jgi:hypothetical protein
LGGAGTTEPAIDGTETDVPADTSAEAPAEPAGEPAEGDDPVKVIQKLTGKLAQKIRDAEEQLTDKDIKYTLNSVISATDINKLSDEDKTDIMNKIESKDEEVPDETSVEEPMAENDEMGGEDNSDFYEGLMNDKTVRHILDMADLNYEASNNPAEIAFDFCEAAYVFIHDYNDSDEFIGKLKSLLNTNQFKARPSLQSKNDLEYFGDMIYDALVKHATEHDGEVLEQDNSIARFTASGGQTVGEGEGEWHISPSGKKTNMSPDDDDYEINYGANAINEHILSILEKARENVKNNLKK